MKIRVSPKLAKLPVRARACHAAAEALNLSGITWGWIPFPAQGTVQYDRQALGVRYDGKPVVEEYPKVQGFVHVLRVADDDQLFNVSSVELSNSQRVNLETYGLIARPERPAFDIAERIRWFEDEICRQILLHAQELADWQATREVLEYRVRDLEAELAKLRAKVAEYRRREAEVE